MALAIAGPMYFYAGDAPARPPDECLCGSRAALVSAVRAPEGKCPFSGRVKADHDGPRGTWACCPEKLELIIHRVLDLDTITVREIMIHDGSFFSARESFHCQSERPHHADSTLARPGFRPRPRAGAHHRRGLYAKDLARLMHYRSVLQAASPGNAIRTSENEMQLWSVDARGDFRSRTKLVSDLLTEFQTGRNISPSLSMNFVRSQA